MCGAEYCLHRPPPFLMSPPSWPKGVIAPIAAPNRPSTGRKGFEMNALSPLGMVSELPSVIQTSSTEVAKDYFVEKDGVKFAGMHLLVDLWGASNLTDPATIDDALREAAEAAGATILHTHFHHFGPDGGVSGVLVLAESHISIHTWPERDFAAIDIFMCGACDPYLSLPVLKTAFQPASMLLDEQRRGRIA
jgi:S-adenosylmethionine decarboxylase